MPDRGAAVRPDPQRVARRSNLGREFRWLGGRGGVGVGAAGGGDGWRRVDAHSGGVQRRRRVQARAGRGAAGIRAGWVRQYLLYHADDPDGRGYRADAERDGRGGPPRSAFDRPARVGFSRTAPLPRRRSGRRRIAWRPDWAMPRSLASVLSACEAAVGVLAELGATVSELTTPFENPESVWFVNNGAYRRAQFGHHLEQHRAIMCPTFVRQMDRVASYSAAELYEAIFARTRLYRQVQAWFDTADIVAMPTLSRPALPIDQDFFGPIEIDNQSVENIRAAWYPYTMPFNLTGNPAISLPCGFDAAGMPLAIQLIARPERTKIYSVLPPYSETSAVKKNSAIEPRKGRDMAALKGSKTEDNLKAGVRRRIAGQPALSVFRAERPTSKATTTSRPCSAPPRKARPVTRTATWSIWKRPATRRPACRSARPTKNLAAAVAGETHEYTDMYPGMARTAREEGFDEVADWFETLAKAERSHAGRFTKALNELG